MRDFLLLDFQHTLNNVRDLTGGNHQLFEHLKQTTALNALMDIQSVYYQAKQCQLVQPLGQVAMSVEPLRQMALSIMRVNFSSALAFTLDSGEYIHPVGWFGDKLILVPFLGDLIPRGIQSNNVHVVKEQTNSIAMSLVSEFNIHSDIGQQPDFTPFDYGCLF